MSKCVINGLAERERRILRNSGIGISKQKGLLNYRLFKKSSDRKCK